MRCCSNLNFAAMCWDRPYITHQRIKVTGSKSLSRTFFCFLVLCMMLIAVQILSLHSYMLYETPIGSVNLWSAEFLNALESWVPERTDEFYCDNPAYDVLPSEQNDFMRISGISCARYPTVQVLQLEGNSLTVKTNFQTFRSNNASFIFVSNAEDISFNYQISITAHSKLYSNPESIFQNDRGDIVRRVSKGTPVRNVSIHDVLDMAGVSLDQYLDPFQIYKRVTGTVIALTFYCNNHENWQIFGNSEPVCTVSINQLKNF